MVIMIEIKLYVTKTRLEKIKQFINNIASTILLNKILILWCVLQALLQEA